VRLDVRTYVSRFTAKNLWRAVEFRTGKQYYYQNALEKSWDSSHKAENEKYYHYVVSYAASLWLGTYMPQQETSLSQSHLAKRGASQLVMPEP
jgi:hypothetical protein